MHSLSERFHKFIFAKRFAAALLAALIIFPPLGTSAFSQEKEAPKQDKKQEKPDPARQEDNKVPSEKELEKNRRQQETKLSQAETIVEVAIFAYGGRKVLETARGAAIEEGTIRLASDQGDITGSYKQRSMRQDKSWKDLLRVDLELATPEEAQRGGAAPSVKYVVGYNGASVWSAQNGQYITPRPEVEAAFRAQLTHEYMTLLRYKEDGSKLELVGPETVVGVPTFVIDLTTANNEKTRYWISQRTYRIVSCEYQLQPQEAQQPIKYRIAYYYTPFKVVQNTLLPTRRVMEQDGKFVQEVTITSATYSAKFDPEIFQHLQE